MSHRSPINIDSIQDEWHPQTWINAGKTYPASDVPLFVQKAHAEVIAIPTKYAYLIPSRQLSITDFSKINILSQASALTSQTGSSSFTQDVPNSNEDLSCLTTRPIPPKVWINTLEKAFGQAWFDGKQSIMDVRYKNSRLPLWVLLYWREMSDVLEKWATWKKAEEWLTRWGKHGETLEQADQVREMMASLNWGSDITVLGASCPKHNLTQFLSDQWMDDEIINMTMHDLAT